MMKTDPKIVVVIPVFKHSVLLTEALNAALTQETEYPYRIVIVNDGCPFEETDCVCKEYALAHPDKVFYIRRPNGGLSAARNTGIEFALAKWPALEAVYLLDADNRLFAHALDRAFRVLLQDPSVAWVYPNIDMFGEAFNCDYAGQYSLLQHLQMNTCEAGSMIRRSIFEAGVRFDESMKLGYEDWEFWLHAASLGFRGRHLASVGFQYRKRPESMVAESSRNHDEIMAYIKRKHRALFHCRNVMMLEDAEAPRYAIIEKDLRSVALTSDPVYRERRYQSDDYDAAFWRSVTMPSRYGTSGFVVLTRSDVLDALDSAKLTRWVFWRLEDILGQHNIAYLILQPSVAEDHVEVDRACNADWNPDAVSAVMLTSELMFQCLRDKKGTWIQTLRTVQPHPSLGGVRVQFAARHFRSNPDLIFRHAAISLLNVIDEMGASHWRHALGKAWEWRNHRPRPRSELYRVTRQVLSAAPVYPRVDRRDSKHAGFILPLIAFGGVEKVSFNVASVLRNAGWIPHLFVFNSNKAAVPQEWEDVFETVNFLDDADIGRWDGSNPVWGVPPTSWMRSGAHERVIGLLSGLDVVFNCHSIEANALMGALRRAGTRTASMLHLFDVASSGRPTGHTYLTLAYEHSYDLITTCSHRLAAQCHVLGIPRAKIVPVPNAPGYLLTESERREILERRAARKSDRLRVLFLGRLDKQKGVHRLAELVRATHLHGVRVDWRIIGSPVLEDQEMSAALREISDLVEAPTYDSRELTRCYEWADVMVLLSAFEGLPLTILEAMRLGVVVCATDVGAVSEVVAHSQNGYLLPSRNPVHGCLEILRKLSNEPEVLERLSHAAADCMAKRTWERACNALLGWLSDSTNIRRVGPRSVRIFPNAEFYREN